MPPHTELFVLDNGLKVILRESHSAPVVSTWVWYRVGSRNEIAGLTGLSHWVEHMLFKGTARYPKGSIMRLVSRHGGYVNAMTSQDFTTYYCTLASDRAHLALDFEADRMCGALLDPEEVETERTVIVAEREGDENDPFSVLMEEVSAAAFRQHPYHHQTIGWKDDLLRITRDDLYEHYHKFYVPNNAVLVIAGDLDIAACARLVQERFGRLEPGPSPQIPIAPEPPQRGERRVTLRMPGAASSVQLSYHAPATAHPDFLPLTIADAVLSGGKAMFSFGGSQARSARLYRALVETELASSVGSDYQPSLDPFFFSLDATVREGVAPEAVEKALLQEIARLQETPVAPHELQVAIRQTQAQFAYSTESVTSQALALGCLEMVDHYERMETMLDELSQVTPADVLRVAQRYLVAEERTVGWFIPTEEGGDDDDCEDTGRADAGGLRVWALRRGLRGYTGAPQIVGPATVTRATLSNGITVLVQERPSSAAVTIAGQLEAGSYLDEPETQGITALTAAMLRRGTAQHTFQELNVALDNVGASFNLLGGRDEISFGGRALGQDCDLLISLMAEMLTSPVFPEDELARRQGQLLTRMAELDMETGYRASRAFVEGLYSAQHPYGRLVLGTRETLSRLDRAALLQHYATHLGPTGTILSVVGAVRAQEVLEKLDAALGRWPQSNAHGRHTPPPCELPSEARRRFVHIPGRPQADLMLGVLGMPRDDADYYPALVANVILSSLGMMGRLGETIREEMGLVYYIGSDLYTSPGRRPWVVSAGVPPDMLEEAITAILRQIVLMRDEPVTEEELADAHALLIGSLPIYLETNEGIASFLLAVERFALGLDYLERYPGLIESVSREQIQQAMQRYWPEGRYVAAAAGTLHGGPRPALG